ncbi:hypothetical protein FACS1894132_05260 [Clostridia bacterium]|nr:hypothetical protein FACS1894132_05260 [Clostridia bacterium]
MKIFKKLLATVVAATALLSVLTAGVTPTISAADEYPWSIKSGGTTGDYLADTYGLPKGSVFESITQERLLDILSSQGNYYILFGGAQNASTKASIAQINTLAKAKNIEKVYLFNPVIDDYQLDITDADTDYGNLAADGSFALDRTTGQPITVYDLWTKITDLLPDVTAIDDYKSNTTLLFNYKNDRVSDATIPASYTFTGGTLDTTAVNNVFGNGTASVRTDYEFFSRIYNGFATYFNANADTNGARTGEASTTIITPADKDGFALHQVTFPELINLLQSPGEKVFFFGASWCHNTAAIIGDVVKQAKAANQKTIYVYDTTIGNHQTYGTGAQIDTVLGASSAFNSRNSATSANYSYLYGEFVKFLKNYTTENNSKQNNSIAYYPNGDLDGTVTSVKPWETGTGTKNAIRLQLPFLIGFDSSKAEPVISQWLHKDSTVSEIGQTYTEYMLEYNWLVEINPIPEYRNNNPESAKNEIDGLTYHQIAVEAVAALADVIKPVVTPDPDPTPSSPDGSATIYDGYYVKQGDTWTFESVAKPEIKKLTIASAVGTEPVTDFVLDGIADAFDLQSFAVSNNSAYFAAKGVALTRFTTKKDKNNKEYKEYALIAYPNAGPKTFTLTKDIVLIGDFGVGDFSSSNQDVVSNAANPFKYAPTGLVITVPSDHPTFVVGPKGLYTYTTVPGEIVEKNGVWVAGPDKKVLGTLILEADGKKLIVKAGGASSTEDPNNNGTTGGETSPNTGDNTPLTVAVIFGLLALTVGTVTLKTKKQR